MTDIGHVAHGWALLALRKPEIRVLAKQRQSIGRGVNATASPYFICGS